MLELGVQIQARSVLSAYAKEKPKATGMTNFLAQNRRADRITNNSDAKLRL